MDLFSTVIQPEIVPAFRFIKPEMQQREKEKNKVNNLKQ